MSRLDEEEATSDGLLASHGGFGKRAGFYREHKLLEAWPDTVSLEALSESEQILGRRICEAVPVTGTRRRLLACVFGCELSEIEERVLRAMVELYANRQRRPVFRAIAVRAGCCVSEAWYAWNRAAGKMVSFDAAQNARSFDAPRGAQDADAGSGSGDEMLDLLVEVFGAYAVRLAGYRL